MSSERRSVHLAVAAACLLAASPVGAGPGPGEPKAQARAGVSDEEFLRRVLASVPDDPRASRTLSPYFFVRSDDPTVDRLPLKRSTAAVQVAGPMADVKLTQVYRNDGTRTLEAVYVFPMSTRAAVHAMRMTVGKRVIEARIREREEARKEYEKARAEGKTSSLLEQQRPNVFQMSVANILPADEIVVEVSYVELIVPEERTYELVIPAVVGPRYSNAPAATAPPREKWVENPHLRSGEEATYTFGVDVRLQGGLPVQQVASPSHTVQAQYPDPRTALVRLPESREGGNRDFVLRYTLAGGKVEGGLQLQPGAKESFFLLQVEPPRRVEPRDVVGREYIFVVDVSGSMHGFPLDTTRALMRDLLGALRHEDHFNVLTFSGASGLLAERSLPATPSNIEDAIDKLERIRAGGGTELLPALKRALELPRVDGAARVMVIATDGYVTVEKEAFDLVRDKLGEASFFAFGIGSSVNRHLIEGLARVGMGEPFVLERKEDAPRVAERFRRYVLSPLLRGVKVRFEGLDAYDVEPAVQPDLFAERPIVVVGKYRGTAGGKITVSGRGGAGEVSQSIDVAGAARVGDGGPLPYLWARRRLERISDLARVDPAGKRKAEIVALGLAYHLMTEHTSFVAVDTVVRADGQRSETVRQPLPLPRGVSDAAVGEGSIGMGGLGIMGRGMGGGGVGYGMGYGGLGLAGYGRGNHYSLGTKGTAPPSVSPGSPMVMGSLDKDVIRRVIRAHLNEVRFCYEKELAKTPTLAGKIDVRFIIGPDGAVRQAKVQLAAPGMALVEACVEAAILRWRFPSTSTGLVIVTYPFNFQPSR